VSESLPALAAVLRAAPGSDALVILGRLLDSLPIPFLVTDCSLELRFVYGNPAWRAGMAQEQVPTAGQALEEILESLSLVPILRHACASGAAAHLRNLEHVTLAGTPVSLPGDVTVWDWEVYPLTDASDGQGHLLIVGMDATGRTIHGPGLSREARRRAAKAGVRIDFRQGDVTHLEGLGLEPGYSLIFDFGCYHGLNGRQRDAYARGVKTVAAEGATVLLMGFGKASPPVTTPVTESDLTSRFGAGWTLAWSHPDTSEGTWAMKHAAAGWFCLVRRD